MNIDLFLEESNSFIEDIIAGDYSEQSDFAKSLIKSKFEEFENYKFPNGFKNWIETFYEIVAAIESSNKEFDGHGDKWEKAEEWTNEFELLNKDRVWDGEFFDEVYDFIDKKLKI